MSANITNPSAYLRTTREFPVDAQALSVEINKAYVDIANIVNNRTIGLFSKNVPAVNGETWFLSGSNQKQQALRRVYTFTAAGNIAHGITVSQISSFTRLWGTFTDGNGNWYPLPYVDVTAANNQVSLRVTSTNIVITAGGGAPPTISKGLVVLEWISNV